MYAGTLVLQTERPMNDLEKLVRMTLAAINPNLHGCEIPDFSATDCRPFQRRAK